MTNATDQLLAFLRYHAAWYAPDLGWTTDGTTVAFDARLEDAPPHLQRTQPPYAAS